MFRIIIIKDNKELMFKSNIGYDYNNDNVIWFK